MPPCCFTAAAHVIHEQFICCQFLRQQDRISLPNLDVSFEEMAIWRKAGSAHMKPLWRLVDPQTYCLGCTRMLQFATHRWWNQDTVVEFGQHLNFANQNEIIDGAGIGDDNHPARRSTSWAGVPLGANAERYFERHGGIPLHVLYRVRQKGAVLL